MPTSKNYTVGWICATDKEYIAAQVFLDEKHDPISTVPSGDNNNYTLGRIKDHYVVIAILPHWQYGLTNAAVVARDMARTFPSIRVGLMVGVGGGAPTKNRDIRLGDVVVSSPGYGTGGILQYDYGKTIQGKKFTVTGYLSQPPMCVLTAMNALKVQHRQDGHDIDDSISRILEKKPRLKKEYGRPETDRLYISSFVHKGTDEEECATTCGDHKANLVDRKQRSNDEDNPTIHYGLIASANQLMQNALVRDVLSKEKDVLCFEMEAAGLMNHFPCVVIRGICDYSDTHKSTMWQGYAAMAAAAYAKQLLEIIPPNKVANEPKISELLLEVTKFLGAIQSQTRDVKAGVERLGSENHFKKLRKWLKAPDPSTTFHNTLARRHEGTGEWLLQNQTYTKWLEEPRSFLWLNGMLGCGKTVLSSTIVEDLQQRNASCPVLYFYFTFTDIDKQDFEHAVCSLIYQLYCCEKSVRSHLDRLFISKGGDKKPSLESLCTVFQNMLQEVDQVWIVLDALDECKLRKGHRNEGLFAWIQSIRDSTVNTHLLVTSRPKDEIKLGLENLAGPEDVILLQGDLIDDDINSYVQATVRYSDGFRRWRGRPDIQSLIETTLIGKAMGMFRWVACQLDFLEKCYSAPDVKEALASLPPDLDETYSRILRNLPPQHYKHTVRILQFLLFSGRPLRIKEAVDAIAVDIEGRDFDTGNRIPIPEEISEYCAGLVVFNQREASYDEQRAMNKEQTQLDDGELTITEIQLAHSSVHEYLLSDHVDKSIAPSFEETTARAYIARVCLVYLLNLDRNLSPEETRQSFALAEYSAQYWTRHASIVEHCSTAVRALAVEFLENKSACNASYRLYDPITEDLAADRSDAPTGLIYASISGLSSVVERLLQNGANVNSDDSDYGTALQAASARGHLKVVQMLIKNGAHVNAQGGAYGNALQAATVMGNLEIVRVLIENDADMDAPGEEYGSALEAAIAEEHPEIVQLLISQGAKRYR